MKKTILNSKKITLSLILSILFVFGFAGKTNAMMLSTSDLAKLLIAVDQQQGGVTSEQAYALGGLIGSGIVPGPGGMPVGNTTRNTSTSSVNNMTSTTPDVSVTPSTDTQSLSKEDQAILDFAKSYVVSVQNDLISKGYLTGTSTGLFDPNTKAAIDNLKVDNKMDAADVSGSKTLTILSYLSALKPAPKHASLAIGKSFSATLQDFGANAVSSDSLKLSDTSVSSGVQLKAPTISAAKLGDTGANVLNIQAVLVNKGLLKNSAATGVFDKTTQAAVSALQTQNGLSAVGSVGPKTTQLISSMINETPALLTAPLPVTTTTTSRNLTNALPLSPVTSKQNVINELPLPVKNSNMNTNTDTTSGVIQNTTGSSVQ